jgi:hypothetical protein
MINEDERQSTSRKYFFVFQKSVDPLPLNQPEKGQNDRNRHGQSDKFRRITMTV